MSRKKLSEISEKKVNLKETNLEESVMSLKGVGPSTYEKLILNGYSTILDIASSNPKLLSSKCDLTEKFSNNLVQEAKKLINLDQFITAEEFFNSRKNLLKIKFNIPSLDLILKGGIQLQSMYEIYGESGMGKTQICFLLAINTILKANQGGVSGKVVYLDTTNSFRPERISEICIKRGYDPSHILKNIFYIRIMNTSHQIFVIEKLKKQNFFKDVRLIIIDSVTTHFRTEYIGRGYLSERQQMLNVHLKELHSISINNNCAIFLTNQVFSKPDVFYGDPVKPVGGHIMAHSSTYRFYIRRAKEGKRVFKIVTSPDLEESETIFEISQI